MQVFLYIFQSQSYTSSWETYTAMAEDKPDTSRCAGMNSLYNTFSKKDTNFVCHYLFYQTPSVALHSAKGALLI